MSIDGEGTLWGRNIAENFNRRSRVHERYRQTDDRQTDGWTTTYTTFANKTGDFYIHICSFSIIFMRFLLVTLVWKAANFHTKVRRHISIHGWDKTTSRFGKCTAATLEFCFLFRFWWMYSHGHVILHLPAKFCSNRTIGGEVMT